jgi:DNA-binding MarR family transcriptional regulator
MAKKLRSLEENGFIDRSIDTHDKRIYHFQLTEKSIKALAEITPIYENALEDIFE